MKNDFICTELTDTSRISFVLGIHSKFWVDIDEKKKDLKEDEFITNDISTQYFSDDSIAKLILAYMDDHRELEDVSMTITTVRGLYRPEYGCPENGEKLYKLTSLYNPLYDQSKDKWLDTILAYAKNLSEYFQQAACTVIIENFDKEHPLQFIYIKNKDDSRTML